MVRIHGFLLLLDFYNPQPPFPVFGFGGFGGLVGVPGLAVGDVGGGVGVEFGDADGEHGKGEEFEGVFGGEAVCHGGQEEVF